jgi:hypothetical protein
VTRYRESARGQILGDDSALIKSLFHREDRRLLGVHAIGTVATESIHLCQAVLGLGGGLDYFLCRGFSYPALGESYRVAALDATATLPWLHLSHRRRSHDANRNASYHHMRRSSATRRLGHGVFLHVFAAFALGLLNAIPLAARAAMLVFTGFHLVTPAEFCQVYHAGKEQLLILLSTIMGTLAIGLLVGLAIGIVVNQTVHLVNGAALR